MSLGACLVSGQCGLINGLSSGSLSTARNKCWALLSVTPPQLNYLIVRYISMIKNNSTKYQIIQKLKSFKNKQNIWEEIMRKKKQFKINLKNT